MKTLISVEPIFSIFTPWDCSVSYIAETAGVTDQYHQCFKVVVSLDNSFECLIDGKMLTGLGGIIVSQTVMHSFFSLGGNVLISFVKSESVYGNHIRKLLETSSYIDLGELLSAAQMEDVLPKHYNDLSNKVLIPHVQAFLNIIFLNKYAKRRSIADKRILSAVQFIDQNLHKTLELGDMAASINLSPEHTRHLFVTQTGIPFSKYVLWKRIQMTMTVAIKEDAKLIEVCLRFGFTDQSHFNHAFKRLFGLSPASMIRYNRVLL